MSNRPLKVSDQKKLNKIAAKKKKQIEFLYQLPPYMFIISEGTKTEPNYIKGIVDKITKSITNIHQAPQEYSYMVLVEIQ